MLAQTSTSAPTFVLGSQSLRRQEIFASLGLPFRQLTSHFDEEQIIFTGDPECYVKLLSESKSQALAAQCIDEVLITADTIVTLPNQVFNKPATLTYAREMLAQLQGRWHSVYTSTTVRYQAQVYSEVQKTDVLFRALTPTQIELYHRLINYSDKAGGYTVQDVGGVIVERIDGCFYNVMGLSLVSLQNLLQKLQIDLWQCLSAGIK